MMKPNEALDIVGCLAWHDLRPSTEEIEEAIKTIGDALKKQKQDNWTPCRETLPDVGQRVLVQYKDGSMAVVRCNDAGHLTWFYARMVAWKPAPAPYQEDET